VVVVLGRLSSELSSITYSLYQIPIEWPHPPKEREREREREREDGF